MREAERHATAEAERLNLRLNRTEAELTEASRDFRDEKRKMEEARELQRVTERQKTALEKQQEEAAAALTAVKAQLDETEADAAAAAARAADDAAAAAMAASESKHRETTLEMDLGATRVALSRTEEGLTETKAREASLRTECHELAATLTIANETKELAVEEARRIKPHPCARTQPPAPFRKTVSVKLRFARPYWNKPVFSRPVRCGSRIGAKRNRHTLNFSPRDCSEMHNS